MNRIPVVLLAVLVVLVGGCSSPGTESAEGSELAVEAPDSAAPDAQPSDEPTDGACPTEGLEVIRVAAIGIYTDAVLDLGRELCYFGKQGIRLHITEVPNPAAALAAVTGGQVDVGYAPSIPVIRAFEAGTGVQALASADGYDQASIDRYGSLLDDTGVFLPEALASPADLEGKTVAVPARGAQLEVTIAAAVLAAGGDPSQVQFVAVDLPEMIDAVQAGQIDAAALVSPFTLTAAEVGLVESDITAVDFFGPGAVGIWTTTSELMTQKGDALRRFRHAIHQANEEATRDPQTFWLYEAAHTGVDLGVIEDDGIEYVFPSTLEQDDFDDVASALAELGFLPEDPNLDGIIAE